MINPEASVITDYKPLAISSDGIAHNGMIPSRFTCDGTNYNPSLVLDHIPEDTRSIALIVDDPDAAHRAWVHWIVWNIPITHHIAENSIPGEEGLNDFHQHHYRGPCPPSGMHRYFFKVYALNQLLQLPPTTTKADLEKAMGKTIIGFGELIGWYQCRAPR